MEINDKSLEALSAGLQIDKGDLTKALESGEIDLSDRVIHSKEDHEKLIKNIKDQEYHKGKEAGFEMPLKDLKKKMSEKYGLETEGIKDFDILISNVLKSETDKLKETYKEGAGKDSEKFTSKIEELEKVNEGLRTQITEKDTTFNTQIQEKDKEFKSSLINTELLKVANSIPFSVPKEITIQGKEAEMSFVKTQTENYLTLLKSSYKFDIVDSKIVTFDGEESIKNKLLETENIDNIALNFAKSRNFNINDKHSYKRDSSQKYGSLFPNMPLADFEALMKEQGHHPNSLEYARYFKERLVANK